MKEYLTTWIWVLFVLWMIGNSLGLKITEYMNMYYLSVILLFGYIIFIFIDMNIKGENYEKKLYVLNALLHALPLAILSVKGKTDYKYAFETTFILSIIYIIYLTYLGTDIVSVYTDERFRFRRIDDIKEYLNKSLS
jgi:amino acid transporter